tara:strand:- start:952 stop:1497 length:546 start_codon:yes stop_codon:yes gene_type:complete
MSTLVHYWTSSWGGTDITPNAAIDASVTAAPRKGLNEGPSLWTDTETNVLQELWGTGVTAREIGATLNRSKGSIIGRANRMGLSKPAPKKLDLVLVEPETKAAKVKAGCQFPLGSYPYSYCGEKTAHGAATNVYCSKHYDICYRKRIGDSDKFEREVSGGPYKLHKLSWGSVYKGTRRKEV